MGLNPHAVRRDEMVEFFPCQDLKIECFSTSLVHPFGIGICTHYELSLIEYRESLYFRTNNI